MTWTGRGSRSGAGPSFVLWREEPRHEGFELPCGGHAAVSASAAGAGPARPGRVVPPADPTRPAPRSRKVTVVAQSPPLRRLEVPVPTRGRARSRRRFAGFDVGAVLQVRVHDGEGVVEALGFVVAVPVQGKGASIVSGGQGDSKLWEDTRTHVRSSVVSTGSFRSRSVLPSAEAYQPFGSPSPFLAR